MIISILGAGGMQAPPIFDYLASKDDVEEIRLIDNKMNGIHDLKQRNKSTKGIAYYGDITGPITSILYGSDVVISCLPYYLNCLAARKATTARARFVDLGGNKKITSRIEKEVGSLAKKNGISLTTDCGLAPGLPSIITQHAHSKLEKPLSINMFCGGLPQRKYMDGLLNYTPKFSLEGLINEYNNPCEVLIDGEIKYLEPLTGTKEYHSPNLGILESFYTSGALSTALSTYKNEFRTITYKTLRYPGHSKVMLILRRLGLFATASSRDLIIKQLHLALKDLPDVVEFYAVAHNNSFTIEYEIINYSDKYSAMAFCTGTLAAVAAYMIGKIPRGVQAGFIPIEKIIDSHKYIEEVNKTKLNISVNTAAIKNLKK